MVFPCELNNISTVGFIFVLFFFLSLFSLVVQLSYKLMIKLSCFVSLTPCTNKNGGNVLFL